MERGVSEPLETEEEINRLHNEKMARRKAASACWRPRPRSGGS
jgi:hypothetical protein